MENIILVVNSIDEGKVPFLDLHSHLGPGPAGYFFPDDFSLLALEFIILMEYFQKQH